MAVIPLVIGERFGRWTITGDAPSKGRYRRAFAECDCGHAQAVRLAALHSGRRTQCAACGRRERGRMVDAVMVHKVFGQWTVTARADRPGSGGKTMWLCRCACGADGRISTCDLNDGRSTRCRSCSSKEKVARRRDGGQ